MESMLILYAAHFFAGAFLCNGVPHFVAGLQGTRFPTPFAKPPGRGKSPAPLNFLWGAFNLALGAALLVWAPLSLGLNYDTLAFAAGALLLGLCISSYFKGA